MDKTQQRRHKVALVTNFAPHYREAMFRLLSTQESPDPEYVIFTGRDDGATVKTLDPALAEKRPEEGGLKWRFLRNRLLGGPFLWQHGVVKVAWSKEFDTIILLGVMYHLSTWVAACVARLRGKRVLMWSHGFTRRDKGLKGWLRNRFYKLAHGMCLYGNWGRKLMIERGFDARTLYPVFNSLDYDGQAAMRDSIAPETLLAARGQLFAHPEFPVLVFLGRFSANKRLGMLIDAAASLHEDGFPVNLLLVGDGADREMLGATVAEKEIGKYTAFTGPRYGEENLAPLLMLADVCVVPGAIGLAAMHALAYGTPCITHDDPEMQGPEFEAIAPGKSGAFFREGDRADLAATIRDWLENRPDPATVREACHGVIAERYNARVQVARLNAAVQQTALPDESPDESPDGVQRRIYGTSSR